MLKRPNLTVCTSATVTKVVFDKSGDKPRAVGVEFTSSRDGPRFEARARKEVILWSVLPPQFPVNRVDVSPQCRGYSHTPRKWHLVFSLAKRDVGVQILMLSGIGPAAQLAFHDVIPLVDLPGVGEHLMDHPVVRANFLEKSGHSLGWMRHAAGVNLKAISALFQWTWMGSGPLTTNVSDDSA